MSDFDRRQREILERLRAETVDSARRRRARRRIGSGALVAAALVLAAALLAPLGPGPAPQPIAKSPPAPEAELASAIINREADLNEYAISDNDLMRALEDAGEPVGLMRIGDRVMVLGELRPRVHRGGGSGAF